MTPTEPAKARTSAGSNLALPSDLEIQITRTFGAPRDKVFRAWTDPELLPRWMNPPQCTMTSAEIDLRPGGRYRHVYTGPHGEMAKEGEFVEIDPPARLVYTEQMGPGSPPSPTTVEFRAGSGTTTVTITHRFPDKETRDAALASGMERLWEHGWGQLDALLVEAA